MSSPFAWLVVGQPVHSGTLADMDPAQPDAGLLADLDAWVEHLRLGRNLSPHTRRAYAGDLLDLATWVATRGVSAWGQVDHRLLRAWLADLHRRGAERQLHRVVITVPETTYVEGLRVARDGVEVRQAAWGTPLPLDPGEHTIEVTAPGRETYRTIVSIEPGPGHTEIVIPPLAESEPETNVLAVDTPARGVGDDATSDPGATRRTIGVVVGSVGAAGLIAGGIFGLRAISLNSSSQDECRTERFCSQAGVELRNDARAAGNWATILGGVGGALVATGIVLWVTAPESGGPELSAVTTGEGASLLLRGTF